MWLLRWLPTMYVQMGVVFNTNLILLENKDSHIVTSPVTDQVLTMVLSGWLSLSLSQVRSILCTTDTDCPMYVGLVMWYGIHVCISYSSYIVIRVLFTHCRQRIVVANLHIHQTRRIHQINSSTINMPRKRSAHHYTNLPITQQWPTTISNPAFMKSTTINLPTQHQQNG